MSTDKTNTGEVLERLTADQRVDLTENWDAFCDADPLPHPREQFPEDLERDGLAECVAVDDDALETPFADERGIYPGGLMWQLTPLGLAVRAHLIGEQS